MPRDDASAAAPPRVFISYSHDSADHAERVLALADRLRQEGVDAWIDQYEPAPAKGWPRWMADEIAKADRVLTVVTETYCRRFEGKETAGGLGVDWEGAILTGELYRRRRDLVVPITFRRADLDHLPTGVQDLPHFVVDGESGYLSLYRHLTGQPETEAPPLGRPRSLPPKPRRSAFGLLVRAPASPEPRETEAVFEYVEWAAERYGHLDLIGLGAGDVRVSLEEIYVPLRILERSGRLDAEGKRAREEAFASGTRVVELDRLFLQPGGDSAARHALILGEAGSGKTTALKKLHQLALERDGEGAVALGLAPETLPVFLRLRRLTPELFEGGLAAFVEAELAELAGGRLAETTAQELVGRRRLLLLFDGLDEIADEGHRARVVERLGWWLGEREMADARAVVSSRYAGWSAAVRAAPLAGFQTLDVRPFDDEQIRRLVELWFREVERRGYVAPAVAAERCAGLIQALTHPEHRRQDFLTLVSTPLLLTLLCLVVMRGGEMPRRRVDFFEECLRVLLGEWRKQKQVDREPPVSFDKAAELLAELAWFLHSSHRRDDLTFPQALQVFRDVLDDPSRASAAFQWLVDDVAVLERYTERHYGFAHLGFQEHSAARHLVDHEEHLDQVSAERGDSWWTEVIQLLASLPGGKGFAPVVRRLLDETPLRHANLLAACLREASDPDLEPFLEVVRGDGDPDRKVAVLGLLRGRREPALLELAAARVADRAAPAALRRMAQQVLDAARGRAAGARSDVFLLHGPGDRRPAEKLAGLLEARGRRVDRPRGAERWDDPRVFDRLTACSKVLVLLGTETPEADDVVALLDGGAAGTVLVRLPGDPRPTVPPGLETLRRVDLASFDAGPVDALVAAAVPSSAVSADAKVSRPSRGVAQVAALEAGQPFTEPLTGELFLPVPAGRFQMGGEQFEDEKPIHWVRLSAFWLARTPVTNWQYRLFVEQSGHREPELWRDRRFADPEQPVVGVDWHDATAYCGWLAEWSPAAGRYELPSEAQWEYAARGPENREFPWGTAAPNKRLAGFGQYYGTGKPAVVGSYLAGAGPFGQLDLAGNVWEWCRDLWEGDYGRWGGREATDPVGEADASLRPLRGGGWWADASLLRSADRSRLVPGNRRGDVGFRVSCSPSSPSA